MSEIVLVVPCFNEAQRLPLDSFRRYPRVKYLFVDDGSRDDTLRVLREFAVEIGADVLSLPRNLGKAEAVRQGCLAALAAGPRYVGYWDADLATPLAAVEHLLAVMDARAEVEIVFGARVRMLGRSIRRHRSRHYLGRVIATAVSLAVGLETYDTQCGAKLFRATPLMELVFRQPFLTRWMFDVEILARLIRGARITDLPPVSELVAEFPLHQWHDVAGSKVRMLDFPRAFLELARIRRAYLGARVGETEAAEWKALVPRDRVRVLRAA